MIKLKKQHVLDQEVAKKLQAQQNILEGMILEIHVMVLQSNDKLSRQLLRSIATELRDIADTLGNISEELVNGEVHE